jgi:hypothetical protein
LKTKYYGIVKGFFKNFKGVSMKRLDAKTNKQQFTIELARRIGSHLIKKLKKALRKHLLIQLNLLEQEAKEIVEVNDDLIVSSVSHRERDYKNIRPYNQLKSLAREEKQSINFQPQKIFDILVIFF